MAISYGTYTITDVQEGSQIWTSSVAPSSPNYTFTVSNLTGDSETSIKVGDIIMYSYYRYTVLSISNDGTTVLTGNRVSIRGATGAASVTYSLIVSNLAIIKDKDGNLSPSSITVTAKSQTGSNAMANYTGRIKIETTTNNSTWTSRINEDASTKTYTIPTDTVAIRCSLYLNGGTTTLLDQQTIPVVSDGLDGTNVTITSTSITYQEGTSGTVKPTGTWKTNVQSVAQGNFLWTKTVVNYSDGSSTESYSVARQGSNGINGTSPTVSNTVVEYQQSTNGKTVPTGTWNTTPPTAIAEQFMWTRTTITYSDSATAISYSVSRNGTNGTSISISSTSVTYQKGTSGTVKPTGTWETNVQPVGEGEYLWTKTVVTYSDSSKTESYSVSRNAVNGTNGTSPTVTSTVTEYVQSNNGTTTPTSGWNTSPPSTVTAGWFMWTRVTVTYSDNATSISYTVSKNGTNGNNGINTATVYLYKKGTTAPSVPSGNTTYTFSTKKLTGTLDSWSQTIPTTGDGECYVTAAVASSSGTTDTIATGEWSTPIQFNGTNGTNGTDGTNGLNQATIFLYKRGASVTKPTTSVTYTFSTGALSAEPNSWKRNIPTIDGNPCWVVTATAIGNGTTATITGSNWSDPVKLVEDGEDGKDAYTIVLTNENHTFAGNSISALASEMECNIIAYKGATQVAATIGTITGQPTGMTTSLSNNGTINAAFSVTVTTSMTSKNGVLNIPITVDGKTFIKKFTYSLALEGEKGEDGGRWYSGTAITGTSTTATIFSGSGITSAVIGDMYLNTTTYNTYRCTLGGNASTAKWVYVNNIKGNTGKGISSITNQYYLSTSNTTQTGGSWSSIVPPYVEDCYYWTKSHIVWTDNTETDTTAVLDNGLTDANANAIDARKVATNYLAVDNTGIMIADMKDGEQIPSQATGKNVFIDNDSVDIRNGQTVLSSFSNNAVILGQLGKSRLVLSPTMISGVSDIGYKNFNIISGDSTEERTITKNETFENSSSESGVFEGNITISDTFYYFHNITATVVFNYIWDGQQKTTNPLTLIVDDPVEDETATAWYIGETERFSSYDIDKEINCSVQHDGETTILHFSADAELKPKTISASYEMGNTATCSVIIETKVYQNTSYTFGSRVVSSEYGDNSFAIGEGLIASSDNQIAIGKFNNDDPNKNYAFMVGNGVYGEYRSNAFAVDWNGHVETGDIDGYGLQLSENSDSEMNDFIKCDDSNDNTIFNVSKGGVVNTVGRINAPNIKLQKDSTTPTDYIQCQDENNNVKFNVSNNGDITTEGDITSTGDADVGGDLSVTGDINALGNINMSGLIQYNNKPMFKVVNKTFTAIGIGSGRAYTAARDIAIDGYKPMSIGGIKLTNSSAYNSSTNADAGWCVIPAFWLDYTTTIDHPNVQSDSIYFYIWNMHGSNSVNVDFHARIVYIAADALGNS